MSHHFAGAAALAANSAATEAPWQGHCNCSSHTGLCCWTRQLDCSGQGL